MFTMRKQIINKFIYDISSIQITCVKRLKKNHEML